MPARACMQKIYWAEIRRVDIPGVCRLKTRIRCSLEVPGVESPIERAALNIREKRYAPKLPMFSLFFSDEHLPDFCPFRRKTFQRETDIERHIRRNRLILHKN